MISHTKIKMDKSLPLLRLAFVPSFLIVIVAHTLTSIHAKTGTITPLNPYTSDLIKQDVEELHDALHKMKLDADTINDILASRSLEQRLIIDAKYSETYNETIVERIRHRVKGIYGGLLLALFKTIPEFYAYDLRNGMYYNNDYTVIQVLTVASKSAELLKNVTIEYKNQHGEELYEAIDKSDFKDDNFKIAMQKILTVHREADTAILDMNTVIKFSEHLHFALQDIERNYEAVKALNDILTILISTPVNVLSNITVQYETRYQSKLHEDLDDKLEGSLGEFTRQLACFMNDEDTYFAELLRGAMKGPGTKESVITRWMSCLSEYNLEDVKKAYKNLYGSSLSDRLNDDLSGHYESMIMAILGENTEDDSSHSSS